MAREWLHFLVAASLCVSGGLAWREAALLRVAAARHSLASRVGVFMESVGCGDFVISQGMLHRAAVDAVREHFYGVESSLLENRLLALAVCDAFRSGYSGEIATLAVTPQTSAEEMVRDLLGEPGYCHALPESAPCDAIEDWARLNGLTLSKLNLADALDLAKPMPRLYAYRAAILATHPALEAMRPSVEADLAAGRQADTTHAFEALFQEVEQQLSHRRGLGPGCPSLHPSESARM